MRLAKSPRERGYSVSPGVHHLRFTVLRYLFLDHQAITQQEILKVTGKQSNLTAIYQQLACLYIKIGACHTYEVMFFKGFSGLKPNFFL